MSPRRIRLAAVLLAAACLSACSTVRSIMDPGNVEYRGASQGPALDVPPDLVTPQSNDRYTLPQRNQPGQTLSDFNRNRASVDAAPRASEVMPQREGAQIQRDGSMRWVVVNQPVEKVWPIVRDFWNTEGFSLATESPQTGIMETEWAERRQRVETSGLRGMISRTFGSSYSTGERDRYRTRLERTPDGRTEIYVSHRGMEEVVTGLQKDQSVWQARESDPELEIEYLRRILVQFGTPRDDITVAGGTGAAAQQPAGSDNIRLVTENDVSRLEIAEGFDRAWREVGLVLDRVGFTVEDRDRSKGTFFVRYVDLDRRDPSQGAISRFFSGERKDLAGQRYQLVVAGAGSRSTVAVREADGNPPASPENQRVANRIIALLHEELK